MRVHAPLCILLLALGTKSILVDAFPVRVANIDKDLTNVLRQNQEWKKKCLSEDPGYFSTLGSGHAPKYLWIGCADARVPANEVMGEDVGSVFVIRNVANMVVHTDFNLMAALQYAIEYLKIPHILVCGHYDCGGIRASMKTKDHVPPLENWLRNIRDVYRLHKDELDAISDPEARHRRLVELNVVEQCMNLFKTGVVQRRRVESYKEETSMYTTPRVHACVFDPKTGKLERLDIDFKNYIHDLHGIYDLYSVRDEDKKIATPMAERQNTFGTSFSFRKLSKAVLKSFVDNEFGLND